MKLCIECKWHKLNNNLSHLCTNPLVPTETDLVTGEIKSLYNAYCSALRIGSQNCGEAGAWFKPLSIETERGA